MKTVYIILLIYSLCAFTYCKTEKEIQVRETILTVKEKDDEWVRWQDEHGVDFYMRCTCPQYTIGFTKSFLISR